jgi:hypothetical protein
MSTTLHRFVALGIITIDVLGDMSNLASLKACDRHELERRVAGEAYIRFGCGVSPLRVPYAHREDLIALG